MKERVLRIVGDNRKDAVILSVYASSVRNGLLDLRTLPHIIESLEHFGKRFPTWRRCSCHCPNAAGIF